MITNTMVGTAGPVRLAEKLSKPSDTAADVTKSFGEFLRNAIDGVNGQEQAVHQATDRFILGQADVSEVMIVSEQAQLSLSLTTQIRNKAIESYQEIMRMQL